jgi:thioredoxin-related protein
MKIQYWTILFLIIAIAISGCTKKDEGNRDSTHNDTPNNQSDISPSSLETSIPSEAVWLTDFEAAKALAAEEGKDLLINFSGSDWCYWCKKLDGEVFSKPAFIEQARNHFVFVNIDFPSDKSGQSKQLRAQNQRLAQIFGIDGYPTVILARPDGTPYARTGYQEGGPDAYLKHLEQLRRNR